MATAEELQILGRLNSLDYHQTKYVAEVLAESFPEKFVLRECIGLMEFQWNEQRSAIMQQKLNSLESQVAEISCGSTGPAAHGLMERPLEQSDLERDDEKEARLQIKDVAIFTNGRLRWTQEAFLSLVASQYLPQLEDTLSTMDFPDLAHQAYASYITNNKRPFVFMDISVNGTHIGKIVYELFDDICPQTAKNFLCLCTGSNGHAEDGTVLSYCNSILHRIVPNGWIQGGDICGGSGSGGMSIYGDTFSDECFEVSHNKRGILGMVNSGRNSNGSQFYITLKSTPWMNKQYVAFGRVVMGTGVLDTLEGIKTFNDRPMDQCIITDCGIFKVDN